MPAQEPRRAACGWRLARVTGRRLSEPGAACAVGPAASAPLREEEHSHRRVEGSPVGVVVNTDRPEVRMASWPAQRRSSTKRVAPRRGMRQSLDSDGADRRPPAISAPTLETLVAMRDACFPPSLRVEAVLELHAALVASGVEEVRLAGSMGVALWSDEPCSALCDSRSDVDLQVIVPDLARWWPDGLSEYEIPVSFYRRAADYDFVAAKLTLHGVEVGLHLIPVPAYQRLCGLAHASFRILRSAPGKREFRFCSLVDERRVRLTYVAVEGGYRLDYTQCPIKDGRFYLEPWQSMALTGIDLLESADARRIREAMADALVERLIGTEGCDDPSLFVGLFRAMSGPLPERLAIHLSNMFIERQSRGLPR